MLYDNNHNVFIIHLQTVYDQYVRGLKLEIIKTIFSDRWWG